MELLYKDEKVIGLRDGNFEQWFAPKTEVESIKAPKNIEKRIKSFGDPLNASMLKVVKGKIVLPDVIDPYTTLEIN